MKQLFMGSIVISVLFFWIGCDESDNPTKPDKKIIITENNLVDTLFSIITKDTNNTVIDSIVKDSIISDTVITIKPISETVDYIIITTETIFDTVFKIPALVESTFIEHYILYKTVIDSLYLLSDTTYSDTVVDSVDTLFEIFINILQQQQDSVDTVFTSYISKIDTQFVTAFLVATTSDSATGNVGITALNWIGTDTLNTTVSSSLLSIQNDNSIYTYNGSIYIVERAGEESVICIDGPVISPNSIIYKKDIGSDVNVRDISFAGENKAYITQFSSDTLAIFDPSTGTITGGIDLSAFGMFAGTDSAEVPFMQCSIANNEKLYVLCCRLKGIKGSNPIPVDLTGLVVVISTINDSLIDTISLTKKNPSSMDITDGCLYISSMGSCENPDDGGIEKIDLDSYTNLGVIIEEALFDGNISDIAMISEIKGYILVSMSDDRKKVIEFNPSSGDVGIEISDIDNASGGICYDGFYLYIGDRSTSKPGIVIINPVDNIRIAGPLILGSEPPSSIAILTVAY